MASNVNINSKIFGTAEQYLSTYKNTKEVQKELVELNTALETAKTELDPNYPNRQLISQHRQQSLMLKIDAAIKKIDKKLPSSSERPSQTTLKQLQQVLKVQSKLAGNPTSKEIRKAIKELDQIMAGKIYFLIWLACGCPKKNEFGRELLRTNTDILFQKFPGFIDVAPGTLITQLAAELKREQELQVQQETYQDLEKLNLLVANNASHDELNRIFQTLPQDVKEAISAFNPITKQTVLSNLQLLRNHPFTDALKSVTINSQKLLQKLKDGRDQEKIAIFNARSKDIYFTHTQLKALFNSFPATAQAHLPKPPYYGRGFNTEIYKEFGAHYDNVSKQTTFKLNAPNATKIDLVLTAWGNKEHTIPLVKGDNGVWTAQTQHAAPGRTYYFMVTGPNGGTPFKKVDPFAFGNFVHSSEIAKENHESVVRDIKKEFVWADATWMEARKNTDPAKQPMIIYEVHVPSWKKKENGQPLNWRELAIELGQYCSDLGYTHLELMGLFEHPRLESMGYQVTSFFSPYSQMGSMEDLQFFVDEMHRRKIGVFFDWVPAHFALSGFALEKFDGTSLLEGEQHPTWGTHEFDYKKSYTRDFLGSNLNYMFEKYHFDGVRVDAVWSMLNLDYDRQSGSRKNEKGGNLNLEAKSFLRNLNTQIHQKFPGTVTIAEESSGFDNTTRPVYERGVHNKRRGLGFDLTWHMGFMNDSLEYFKIAPEHRPNAHHLLVKSMKDVDGGPDCRPRGKVVLPLSHDESANGKMTIKGKMPGNAAEKFANGRLLFAFNMLRGGGPVLDFMGNEILQSDEWHGRMLQSIQNPNDPWEKKKSSVQWEELDPNINPHNHQYHKGTQTFRKALNHCVTNNKGLWDQTDNGFSWIDSRDEKNSVISFHRRGNGEQLACVFNFSNKDLNDYLIPLPSLEYAPELARLNGVKEIFNTDALEFAGEGRKNASVEIVRNHLGQPTHLKLRLPPLTSVVLAESFA